MEARMPAATLIRPLTGARFFAAAAVVVYHSGATWVASHPETPALVRSVLLNGYLGVTFFFVLSGFILHFTYRGGIAGAVAWRRYGVARFARIYPTYLLALVAMAPFVHVRDLRDVPQFALLQWWPPVQVAHWSNWNMPAWTLSVECFFYCCFPLLSRGAARQPVPLLWTVIGVLWLFDLTTGSSAIMDGRQAWFDWMTVIPIPLLRLPEFVIGIAFAELHLRQGGGGRVPAWLAALALLAVLGFGNARWVAGLATGLSALTIAAIAADRRSLLVRLLSARTVVLLGGASYALYLLHQPVHFAVARLLGGSKLMLAAQYPVLLIAAVAVFLFVEEPAREWIRARAGMKPSAIEPIAVHPAG
ncbi:MAG: acyltransferase family protein [Sphingomonas sp.]|uniref:acyltransferase family protein n=1 Tax=Sphingomonas sp. TaxID=28214 RepID=UPI003F7CF56C